MLNVIRSDLIKIKKSSWFNFLMLFWVLIFTLIFSFLYFQILKTNWYPWFFTKVLWFDEQMTNISFLLYTFIIFWFSLLSDIFYSVDKSKNLILFTKNIRIWYFISKIILILFFSLLVLFLISLFSSLWVFIFWDYNIDLFLKSFEGIFLKMFLFFLTITPLLISFIFVNLIWIRSIFISIFIIFFYFIWFVFWDKIYESDIWKYYKFVNNYTLIWNYNNILNSTYNDKNSYTLKNIDKSYIKDDDVKKYEDEKLNFKKLTLINEFLMNIDFINNSFDLDNFFKDKPKLKSKFDELNILLKNDLSQLKDEYMLDKYQKIYNKLWGDEKLYNYENTLKELESRTISKYNSFWISAIKNIFVINLNFYVWFFHILFLVLVWSIIIKRRQIYN